MKNPLLKKLLRLAHPWIRKHPINNRILIVSTTALGDTLWTTAAVENIRLSFPKAHIAILTRPIGKQVFQHNPHIDQIHLLPDPLLPSFFSLWKSLYQERFDTILLFHASQRLVLPLCSLLGASRIIGTSGINKGLDSLLTHPLPHHAQHEIVRRLKIAEQIGAKTLTEKLSFFLTEEERKKARLPSTSKGPWIALHPGSKDGFKRWPASHFAKLGRLLKSQLACEILVTGVPEEKALVQEVAAQIPGAHLLESNLSLRSFAALLEKIDLLISNDTGPVHLACALQRPVLALYGPTDPFLCGPHQAPHSLALSKRPSCDPCLKRKCRLPFCLWQFGPEEVAQQALALLQRAKI